MVKRCTLDAEVIQGRSVEEVLEAYTVMLRERVHIESEYTQSDSYIHSFLILNLRL